ncbi:MAG: PD-(D/E)XK nuclease family transposase [Anaerostipes hadrus]
MSQTKKSLQDLTLLDRFLFAEVMEDAETFENVLSIILGQDISIKGHPQSEHEKRTSPLKRQVRLDVWAEDDTDAVYNIEAQKENTKNLPHRSRFYQALIDSKLLDPGEIDFSKMKDCYSIIIAPFDLFGEGLYQYTFQMNCNETGQPLNDGAIRIFLNTHGQNPEDISSELKELLYYMEHTTEDIFCSTPRLQEIKKTCQYRKIQRRDWSEIYAGMGRKKFLRNEKHVLRDLLRDVLKDLLREITFD